jgi:hypothetical protein
MQDVSGGGDQGATPALPRAAGAAVPLPEALAPSHFLLWALSSVWICGLDC